MTVAYTCDAEGTGDNFRTAMSAIETPKQSLSLLLFFKPIPDPVWKGTG